ncbi:MAG: type II toxin-antitoxin system PemK/MazF family toxin [Luteitalea sp.]|nr:type II toxin-antitoxin system PemK/MazF family toxin [Luteitalea sp.]
MSRGDLVTVAMSGDYGKPRPALVVQADAYAAHPSVTLLLLTSELHEWPLFRISIQPGPTNGLQKPSQIMIDKAVTVPRQRIGQRIGCIDADAVQAVNRALTTFLGLD